MYFFGGKRNAPMKEGGHVKRRVILETPRKTFRTGFLLSVAIFSSNFRVIESVRNTEDGNSTRIEQSLLSSLSGINVVPLKIGLDFTSVFSDHDILRGFKTNIDGAENPMKGDVFKGTIDTIRFENSYSESFIIKNDYEFRKMMEIDGGLSMAYGPVSGSGSGRYLQDKMSSKRQATLTYRTRKVAYARQVDVSTLQPVDSELENLLPNDIADRYGTKFINSVIYGAQLDIVFTLISTKDIDIKEIEAELKGKFGFGALSIGFRAKFEKKEGETKSELEISCVASASGVNVNIPGEPSFDEVSGIINDFNQKYTELLEKKRKEESLEGFVLNQMSPVAFTLSSIADHITNLNSFEVATLDSKMTELSNVFFSSLFLKSKLNLFKETQRGIYSLSKREKKEVFRPYESAVDSVIAKLSSKISECLNYRRESLGAIIGREGAKKVSVPERYPKGERENDIVDGLLGDLYLPSPLTIRERTFDNMYYEGYAIYEGGKFKPWMEGAVRKDEDDSFVAKGVTPEKLEANVKIALGECSDDPDFFMWKETRRNCSWLKKRKSRNSGKVLELCKKKKKLGYTQKKVLVADFCPETCGRVCAPSMSPTPAPTLAPTIAERVEIYAEVGYWGDWRSWKGDTCNGLYACGAEVRAEDFQGGKRREDDTALNGLRLQYCNVNNVGMGPIHTIEEGLWGNWKGMVSCPDNEFIIEIKVRSQEPSMANDNIGLNGMAIRCSEFQGSSYTERIVFEGHGINEPQVYGYWRSWVGSSDATRFLKAAKVRFLQNQGSCNNKCWGIDCDCWTKYDDKAMTGLMVSFEVPRFPDTDKGC